MILGDLDVGEKFCFTGDIPDGYDAKPCRCPRVVLSTSSRRGREPGDFLVSVTRCKTHDKLGDSRGIMFVNVRDVVYPFSDIIANRIEE